MESALGYSLIVLLILVLFFLYNLDRVKKKKSKVLFAKYQNALKGQDKQEALRLGRLYYGVLRSNGRLTIYDEQAITNDINTMK